jgi:thymidylate synthase
MRQYLDAVKQILETGTRKENRTGVDTLSTFGVHYNIDLQQGFPLLTTKKISWKNIVVEMLWFLSGQTDISILKKHDCKFWDAWADPETGKVPSAYGNFWRKFPVHGADFDDYGSAGGDAVERAFNDQLAWVVETLKRDPMSRRMVVSAWAPGNTQTSKLPPCHCMFAVNVQNYAPPCVDCLGSGGSTANYIDRGGHLATADFEPCSTCNGRSRFEDHAEQRLCLHLTQRSCDIALGVPYNIASYALLMHLLSRFSGIPVGTFSHTLVDAHAYTSKPDGSMAEFDHVPGLKEQLRREPRNLPTLTIDKAVQGLDDIEKLLTFSTDDLMTFFKLDGYEPHPAINFKVAV